jgi:hypothetical protein
MPLREVQVRITDPELLKVALIRALPSGHPENRRNLETAEFVFAFEGSREKKRTTTTTGAKTQDGR